MSWLSPPHPPRAMILSQDPSITIIFNDNIKSIQQAGILHWLVYCNSSKEEGSI